MNDPIEMGEAGRDYPVIMILLDDDGGIGEWLNADTYFETVQNFATSYPTLLICEGFEDHKLVKLALHERELYADCFGLEVKES